jgi:hypothetical protein
MRHCLIASTLASAVLAASLIVPGLAMAQDARPGQQQPAPIKPYTAVAVQPPKPMNDPGLDSLRKQLADAASRKDRAALGKLVVTKGFFWLQDKDRADAAKPGVDSLARAVGLDAKDGSGWEALAAYADDPTAMPMPDRKSVACSPAAPNFDPAAFDAVVKATQTDPAEWGYIVKDGTEARAAAKTGAAAVEKLGLIMVRVLADDAPPDGAAPAFIHVATPSGKSAFVSVEAIVPLAGDEICYARDTGGWKITGYIGGVDQ